MALVFVPASGLALHEAGDNSGSASGLLNAAQQIGGALGIALTAGVAAAARERSAPGSGSSPAGQAVNLALQGDRAGLAGAVVFVLALVLIGIPPGPAPRSAVRSTSRSSRNDPVIVTVAARWSGCFSASGWVRCAFR